MKSSPLIDFSFSAVSSAVIAGLFYLKPSYFELFVIAAPLSLSLVFIALRYLSAWLQISDYEAFAALKKLKNRKKFLHSCLNDKHLSQEARQKHQQDYEQVISAIDKCLD